MIKSPTWTFFFIDMAIVGAMQVTSLAYWLDGYKWFALFWGVVSVVMAIGTLILPAHFDMWGDFKNNILKWEDDTIDENEFVMTVK